MTTEFIYGIYANINTHIKNLYFLFFLWYLWEIKCFRNVNCNTPHIRLIIRQIWLCVHFFCKRKLVYTHTWLMFASQVHKNALNPQGFLKVNKHLTFIQFKDTFIQSNLYIRSTIVLLDQIKLSLVTDSVMFYYLTG